MPRYDFNIWSRLTKHEADEYMEISKRASTYIKYMSIKEKDRPPNGPSDLPDQDWIRMSDLWWKMWGK